MLVPELSAATDLVLLALRLLMGALFVTSGCSHARAPRERAGSIGMSPAFTFALGLAEVAGGLSVALGLFAQAGALLLMGVMVGAMHKKIFVWKTGFWGQKGNGWFYDLLYFWVNGLVVATGGGAWTIL